MLKFFCSSLLVDINSQQIRTSLQPAKFRKSRQPEVSHPFVIDGESESHDFAKQWAAVFANSGSKSGFLEIIMDDTLVKYFVLTPPANARSLKDFHTAALMRLETLFGVTSDDWQISADWQKNRPSLVCAMPKALLKKISHASKKTIQHILSLQPRFVWRWNQCKQRILPEAWFISVEKQSMTLAAVHDGYVCMLKTILLPDETDETWLRTQLQRAAILHQLPQPGQLLLVGEIPAAWKCTSVQQTNLYQIAKKDLANKHITTKATVNNRAGAA
ncbi:MAG: hypothetical protein WA071_19515 [Undibacterium umbellatum]|uniref:hypothetical protein n=1 Tax=Undibacterium umbellatum TaxID=2762300 RepID=UPI003BB6240D